MASTHLSNGLNFGFFMFGICSKALNIVMFPKCCDIMTKEVKVNGEFDNECGKNGPYKHLADWEHKI